ncbi:MAG: flagellar biosynthetic protein FliO [Candidatus Eremiobacteraeota bacterium]|nr:flagellar biosynthetic protein FliO [Candidatus Eremiobacteraeota bacterium]
MDITFAGRYVLGLAIVGALLFALWFAARAVRSGSLVSRNDKRLIRVVQSTLLSPDTAVHVVKIAEKYYALAGGNGHICVVCELPAQIGAPSFNTPAQVP